jgi:ElaB/YqjD/DUF883 family membrane-anchored ribosome-binding protein
MSRTYKSLLGVAAILGVIAVAGLASAGPQRHFPFFPHPRPMPPTTNPPTTNPPGTTPMNPTNQQLAHRQRLFMLMMLARMQTQPTYPTMMTSMGSMSYPYPMPYPMQQANAPAPVNNAAPVAVPPLLAGIVDAQGHVAWPLGLQILRPALETKALRQRVESLLTSGAAATGREAAPTVAEAGQAVMRLRQALREQRTDMAEATHRDASAFLDRIEAALQAMGEGKGGY